MLRSSKYALFVRRSDYSFLYFFHLSFPARLTTARNGSENHEKEQLHIQLTFYCSKLYYIILKFENVLNELAQPV